jgi:hypothetical protein
MCPLIAPLGRNYNHAFVDDSISIRAQLLEKIKEKEREREREKKGD